MRTKESPFSKIISRQAAKTSATNAAVGPAVLAGKFSNKRMSFAIGLGLTALLGLGAILLAPLPGLAVMGSLTVAMLLGIIWRSLLGHSMLDRLRPIERFG